MKAKVSSLTVLLGILATLPHCGSSGDDTAAAGGTSPGGAAGSTAAAGTGGASAGTSSTTAGAGGSSTTAGAGGSGTTTAGTGGTGEGGEAGAETTASLTIKGLVTSAAFTPGSATEPNVTTGYFAGATVCVDTNNNGKCDSSEPSTTTSSTGAFSLTVPEPSGIIADIGTTATNTANNKANPSRNVFRASLAQVTEQGQNVVLSPLSTEVVRLTEANSTTYAAEKQNLATRVGVGLDVVSAADVLSDVNTLPSGEKSVVSREANILGERFQYAITKLDRGDKYPDALAVPGNDPELYNVTGVTAATAPTAADARPAITFAQAEQAAFNIEAIPRYDHIFIIMLENKSTEAILGSAYAPKINGYLAAGNQAISYYATGNPSEPNYTALGGADDFGITDDNQWNCGASGANAVQDLPEPDNTQPGLANSPFKLEASASCGGDGAVHNIVGRPNLFNAITAAGMTWRTYSESMNPGQDFRTDSIGDPAVKAQDHVYPPGTLAGNAATIGDTNLILPMPTQLYRTKHHPGMAYQNVRSEPDFKYNNRTLGGGQWDGALANSSVYTMPAGYDTDQFGTDLETGNIGNLNFVVPDQCDDMHGIGVPGTESGSATTGNASDCSGVANNVSATAVSPIIARGDAYVDKVIKKIETSDIWKNPQKHVAIVIMFDEGNSTIANDALNSCCGWKPGTSVNGPLVAGTTGYTMDTTVAAYKSGNQGHGMSIFGILTNQASAPKQIQDSDAYSHFSFVRTLQDMFGLADPASDASYMNRSKYTEKFIAQNILNLPEYTSSADTHYDSVRPMNHAYVIPAAYQGKVMSDQSPSRPAKTGPDANQTNVWSLK